MGIAYRRWRIASNWWRPRPVILDDDCRRRLPAYRMPLSIIPVVRKYFPGCQQRQRPVDPDADQESTRCDREKGYDWNSDLHLFLFGGGIEKSAHARSNEPFLSLIGALMILKENDTQEKN